MSKAFACVCAWAVIGFLQFRDAREGRGRREEEKLKISAQIKKYRTGMNLSQEELAEKLYVSRQTISNWETGKSYPDIHSLLLLGTLFQVSLDELIKGDIEVMKEEIQETEIKKLRVYGKVLTGLMAAMVLSAVPLSLWLGVYGMIFWGVLAGATVFVCYKVEQVKKDNRIHTYKEIVAFMNGKRLDEMQQQQELGKRPYQRLLLALASAMIALVVCMVLGWLLTR